MSVQSQGVRRQEEAISGRVLEHRKGPRREGKSRADSCARPRRRVAKAGRPVASRDPASPGPRSAASPSPRPCKAGGRSSPLGTDPAAARTRGGRKAAPESRGAGHDRRLDGAAGSAPASGTKALPGPPRPAPPATRRLPTTRLTRGPGRPATPGRSEVRRREKRAGEEPGETRGGRRRRAVRKPGRERRALMGFAPRFEDGPAPSRGRAPSLRGRRFYDARAKRVPRPGGPDIEAFPASPTSGLARGPSGSVACRGRAPAQSDARSSRSPPEGLPRGGLPTRACPRRPGPSHAGAEGSRSPADGRKEGSAAGRAERGRPPPLKGAQAGACRGGGGGEGSPRSAAAAMVHAFLVHDLRARRGEAEAEAPALYCRVFAADGPEERRTRAVARQVAAACRLQQAARGRRPPEPLRQPPDEAPCPQEAALGAFRLPAGGPFPEDKTVLWLGAQRLAFALVCDADDNLALAESTLGRLASALLEHLRPLGPAGDVLPKADRVEAVLDRLLPHGQLLFLNDQFAAGLEREWSAHLGK
ncbi:AP-5 complex subunit sigma-1 [Liasis olivaceus]